MSHTDALIALGRVSRRHAGRLRGMTAFATLDGVAKAAEPLLLARLFDEAAGPGRTRVLVACLAGWVGLALVSAFATRRRDRFAAGVAADVSRELRIALADRQLHARGPSQSLEVTGISGVEGVTSALHPIVPSMVADLAGLAAGVVSALVLDWRVAIIVVLAIGPMAWVHTRLLRRRG